MQVLQIFSKRTEELVGMVTQNTQSFDVFESEVHNSYQLFTTDNDIDNYDSYEDFIEDFVEFHNNRLDRNITSCVFGEVF